MAFLPAFLRTRVAALACLTTALAAVPSHASQPQMWYFADDNDFRRGNLDGLVLHPTLGLSIAPKVSRSEVDAEFVHCWVRDGGGKLWLGTGLQGKVFVYENGKARELAKVNAPMVASLAVDGSGGVYAGLVGSGEIAQVSPGGQVSTLIKLDGVNHIWALVKRGNTLYAGTGPGGKVYTIDLTSKTAKIYAETSADHVLNLMVDGDALIAGTSDPAMILRIDGEKQVRALAAFPGVEVRSIMRVGKALYAVVNGGATAVPLASLKPTADHPGTTPPTKGPTANKTGKDAAAKGKGAVWKRSDDGIVSRVFVSPEGMLSEIGAYGRSIVAGCARGGRVVIGDDFGDVQSLFDLKEEEVLGIEMGSKGPQTLFTGKSAAIYTVGVGEGGATFTSDVLAETGTAIWGKVEAIGEGGLEVETRSGFSEVTNDTWSPWIALRNGTSQSPPANFLQVRVKLMQANSRLTELKIFRQVANRAPMITKIDANVNKKTGIVNVTWTAEDADGDTLGYIVQYRQRGTKQWLVLHDRLFDKKSIDLTPSDMPDGWYELRVEVTDLPANGPKTAKATARISKPVLIDRGRPDVTAEVKGRLITGLASDAISRIVKVEVSVDGEPTMLAAAKDGVFDQASEAFELDLPTTALTGPHTLLLTVTDEAGNTNALRVTIGQ